MVLLTSDMDSLLVISIVLGRGGVGLTFPSDPLLALW
jgi:hypothetical protein